MRTGWAHLLIGVTLSASVGCSRMVKRTTRVDVPPAYREAREAGLPDLVELINGRYAGLQTLSVAQMEVEFQSGSANHGYFEKYPRGKGYLVARWPDSILVNILNPLTSSTVAILASRGEEFQIWVPRENKYFVGRTGVRLEGDDPLLNVRPHHILQGLLIEKIPVDDQAHRYFLEEDQDGRFKYYVVGIIALQENSSSVRLVRKLWIERSEMRLVRQQYFGESGEISSDIRYNHPLEVFDLVVNSGVEITRTGEGYTLRFDLKQESLKVNHPLPGEVFQVPRPPGAEIVRVQDPDR